MNLETIFGEVCEAAEDSPPEVEHENKQEQDDSKHKDAKTYVWKQKIEPFLQQLRTICDYVPSRTVGIFGPAGSGKSSLINNILGTPELLPVYDDDTCTASITHVTAWDRATYSATVYFIDKEEWDRQYEVIKEFYDQATEEEKDKTKKHPIEVKAHMARLSALWKRPITRPIKEIPKEVDAEFTMGYVTKTFDTYEKLKEFLAKYSHHRQRLWPVVDRIYVYGPFNGLVPGVSLVDIPGTGDGHIGLSM